MEKTTADHNITSNLFYQLEKLLSFHDVIFKKSVLFVNIYVLKIYAVEGVHSTKEFVSSPVMFSHPCPLHVMSTWQNQKASLRRPLATDISTDKRLGQNELIGNNIINDNIINHHWFMAWCGRSAKPLTVPMLTHCQLDPYNQTSVKSDGKYKHVYSKQIDTLRPRQNGHHFPDNIFKCIFLNNNQ